MPLPIKDVIRMIIENTRKSGAPIPLPPEIATGWADGMDIPRGGETVIYTGLLYQLLPYLNASIKKLESLEENAVGATLLKLGKIISKVIDINKLISSVSRDELEKQYDVLRSIAIMLRNADIEYGYLYEDEMYSGVLLFDMGLDDFFKEHIEKVYSVLRKNRVKRIITIDPHTTHVMRTVYPKYLPEYDIEVKNYLEILSSKGLNGGMKSGVEGVIHDPCYYARFQNIIDEPRQLLNAAGVTVLEPPLKTRKLTFCCGGPIESISPKLSRNIAEMRLDELKNINRRIIVLCPICYSNFSRVADRNLVIEDISRLLVKAFGE